MKHEVVTITELRIASRNPQGKEVNTLRLAKVIHDYIVIDGCIFESDAKKWIESIHGALSRVLENFGESSSNDVKKAFSLIDNGLKVSSQRTRRQQKSSEQVAIAA